MKIFYSWQSDSPNSIGRSFIRSALDKAVAEILEGIDLHEADRPVIDQDTQGVLGAPAIAETIFEKIRNSDVLVCDITLVGSVPDASDKKLLNSNVAIELGFALGHHGDHILLSVMNTYYGSPEDLPFDLQHRRWPITYNLPPDASSAVKNKAKKSLTADLLKILKLYLESKPPKEIYQQVPSTDNPAMFWSNNEYLVQNVRTNSDEETANLTFFNDQPIIYLRLWPSKPLPHFSGQQLGDYKITQVEPLLGRSGGYSTHRNKYGAITFSGQNAGQLISATQVFKNREIWGVEGFILNRLTDEDFDYVPTSAFEEGIKRSLNLYLQVAFNKFDYPDVVNVEVGMVNVEDFKLAMPSNYWERFWGPIFENIIVQTTIDKNDPDTTKTALIKIFDAVFDAAGAKRPQNLYGFPDVN